MKIRRKKLDAIFSKLVRERVNYVCQSCGVNKRMEPATLDCAHIMSRRSLGLRYHPRNAIALCRGCHMHYTEHPFEWRDFCVDQFGEDFIAELRLVSSQTVKWTKAQREEIYKHYQNEFKEMEYMRQNTGLRIEFAQHELMHQFTGERVSKPIAAQ